MTDPQPSIEDLFHRARALPASERAPFLDRVLANDPKKRARVELLLAADLGDTSDFLAPKRPAAASDGLGDKAGDIIDRYKLLQSIGEGGMGTVWMAEQKEPVVRKVALKIVKLGMDTREVVVRFEAERQALALMDHPNIARVLDGGATPTGRPFFVMELVRGVPITDYCDQAKLGLRQRLELFAKVCDAIQHAHHKGVIHRDIKPSNVLVTLHDGVPVPKVIDFGIAKATSAELTKKTLFTQYAQILGTPEYMAPEQAEMSGLDVDTRADVYSLGVLLYELLTGTKPFDIKTAMRIGFQELLRTIREDDPPKPSTRVSTLGEAASPVAARRDLSVRTWSERLRGDLDWIVMKALEKDRTRRYDTPHHFAEDVARFLRDEAVSAAPPGAAYRLSKFVRRRRKTVFALGAVATTFVLGLVGTTWGLLRAIAEKQRADEAAVAERTANHDAQQRAADLAQVSDFQAAQLAALDPQWMGQNLRQDLIAAVPAEQRDRLDEGLAAINFTNIALQTLDANVFARALAAIDAQFGTQPVLRARLLQVMATTLVSIGLNDRALPPQQAALAIRTRQLGADHPDTLDSMAALGVLHKERGELGDAERAIRAALEARQRVLGGDDPRTLASSHDLGAVLRLQGKLEQAEASLQATLAAERRVLGEDHTQTLHTLNSLGVLLTEKGRYEDAEPLFRDLVEGFTSQLGADDPVTLNALNTHGGVLTWLDRFDEAEPLLRHGLERCREKLGDEHPLTLNAMHSLASLLQRRGANDASAALFEKAAAGRRRVLGLEHPETLSSTLESGLAQRAQHKWAESERSLRDAHDGYARRYPEQIGRFRAAGSLALVLRELERVDEALPLAREALDGCRRILGNENQATIEAMNDLGSILWAAGHAVDAVPLFRECLELHRRRHGEDHPATLLVAANLGVNLRDTGKVDEAIPLLQRAFAAADKVPDLRWVGQDLLLALAQQKRTPELTELASRLVAQMRVDTGDDTTRLATGMAAIAHTLLTAEAWTAGEQMLRDVLAMRSHTQPDAWQTFNTKAELGAALSGQRRFDEAESMLAEGAAGLWERRESMPPPARVRVKEAVALAIALYDAWENAEPGKGHGAKAGPWREKAAELDAQK